jgi:hypothetical protein
MNRKRVSVFATILILSILLGSNSDQARAQSDIQIVINSASLIKDS